MFLVMCYKCGLSHADLELFTIGMCLDYIQEYVESMKDKPKNKKATQADMDAF